MAENIPVWRQTISLANLHGASDRLVSRSWCGSDRSGTGLSKAKNTWKVQVGKGANQSAAAIRYIPRAAALLEGCPADPSVATQGVAPKTAHGMRGPPSTTREAARSGVSVPHCQCVFMLWGMHDLPVGRFNHSPIVQPIVNHVGHGLRTLPRRLLWQDSSPTVSN